MRKVDKIRIAGTKFDARRKLSSDQKNAIKILSREGYSQRRLAAMFNVSKWTIQSILTPPIRQNPQCKHTAAYWKEVKDKCVARKTKLYMSGKIKENKK